MIAVRLGRSGPPGCPAGRWPGPRRPVAGGVRRRSPADVAIEGEGGLRGLGEVNILPALRR